MSRILVSNLRLMLIKYTQHNARIYEGNHQPVPGHLFVFSRKQAERNGNDKGGVAGRGANDALDDKWAFQDTGYHVVVSYI